MTIFNILLLLALFGHPKTSESLNEPGPIPSVDSLIIIEKVYLHTDRDIYYPGDDI